MSKFKPTHERYTMIQVIVIVMSILVYVYINREDLATEVGWRNFMIYSGFNLAIAIAGQKVGSVKIVIRRLRSVFDGQGTADARLNEAMHVLRIAAANAGIEWEHYNKEALKKMRKQAKKDGTHIVYDGAENDELAKAKFVKQQINGASDEVKKKIKAIRKQQKQ